MLGGIVLIAASVGGAVLFRFKIEVPLVAAQGEMSGLAEFFSPFVYAGLTAVFGIGVLLIAIPLLRLATRTK